MQYNTKEYSAIQHNTRQTIRYATLLYNTTHTDKHAVHYVNFVSCPYLRLPALHCIKLHILLHYIALQYISLHYNPLRYTTLHCNDVIPRVLTGTQTYRYIHRNMDVYINT